MQVKEVGGDFFDVIAADDGSFLVLIGDVSGKGLPAALLMSAVLTLFRSEAKHGGSADELLSRLNRQLVDALQGNLFVTAGIAAFERNGGMSYASAGHLAPYLIRRNGEVGMIPVSSLPLGIDESIGYESTYVRLEPGDRVFFYTDGVVEAPHPKGGIIGFDRLEQLLGQLPANLSPEEQMNALLAQLSFPETQADDDRTLLLVAVNE
jgi:serine phosphatase RsbU (regulator of sigma subunit)